MFDVAGRYRMRSPMAPQSRCKPAVGPCVEIQLGARAPRRRSDLGRTKLVHAPMQCRRVPPKGAALSFAREATQQREF